MSLGHFKEDPVAEMGGDEDDDGLSAHDSQSLLHSSLLFYRSGSWYHRVKCAVLDHSVLVSWALNAILLVSLVLVIVGKSTARCKASPDDQGGRYSPAEDAVEYVPVLFKLGNSHASSPYQGFPTDETDRLWQELYGVGTFLHVDEDAGNRLLNTSVKAPVVGSENDLMVGLDVFHQLHCLNQIRMAFYPRRYNTSLTNPDGTVKYIQWLHIDHCVESLRQSIMCHSDTSLITYKWLESKKITELELEVVHMCRNFDKIQDWASQRTVNLGSKRLHVENGAIVDYTGWGPDPEAAVADDIPSGWNYTIEDL
ncbi:hypothetical protein H634G_07537 [Metarhizium anisopliae BRIP 53293]|uniref:Tat pathway signal sequence n=1 Tax=Metarhizium anisopliae BRIP 53293 TaxID=1291518 RepID=A0A0D9NTH4_METAN|nr:hypothetical protein H634G_07537 [Metarhizium anisopliae BRIP 53293]KJK91587.1 hypothetical protein H633G_04508 [Metarhizium anisopliae BRIP 53284]